jgi:DNA-binding MarR family transcriptional regulator
MGRSFCIQRKNFVDFVNIYRSLVVNREDRMREQGAGPGTSTERVHPPIGSIRDALSFRIARMAAINERAGGFYFQNELGLRLNEWRVLGLVAAAGVAAFSDIRDQLLIDKGQLSRVVASLVGRGLLESRPSASDARQVDLSLTAKGRALHDRGIAFTAERNEAMADVLSAAECRHLLDMLDRLIAHNEALQEQPGGP